MGQLASVLRFSFSSRYKNVSSRPRERIPREHAALIIHISCTPEDNAHPFFFLSSLLFPSPLYFVLYDLDPISLLAWYISQRRFFHKRTLFTKMIFRGIQTVVQINWTKKLSILKIYLSMIRVKLELKTRRVHKM